jgi:hypothetical protein
MLACGGAGDSEVGGILRVITSVELRSLRLLLFLPTRRLEIQLCLLKALEYL